MSASKNGPAKSNASSREPQFVAAMLHPRYWLTWLGLGVGWLTAHLPFAWQMALGRIFGRLMFSMLPRRVHIARTNLKLCFPGQDEDSREQLLRASFTSLGIAVMETIMSWWAPDRVLKQRVQIEGLEHLQQALAEERGVILLSGHFTTLEIGARLLSIYSPLHVLYRKHKNPVFELIMHRGRSRHFEKAIERGNMRGMMRSLKQKMAVWYAPDQNYGVEHSVFVDFFNIPAATITATSRLAGLNHSPVVPFFQQRLADHSGYLLRIYPPLENFPSDDEVTDTRRINQLLEEEIMKMPEQYLWTHRRFKSRPDKQPSFY